MATHPHWKNSPTTPDTKLEALLKEHMAAQAVQHAEQMAVMNALLVALSKPSVPPSLFYPQGQPPKHVSNVIDPDDLVAHANGVVTAKQDFTKLEPEQRWPAEPHFAKPRSTADIINSMWKQRQ